MDKQRQLFTKLAKLYNTRYSANMEKLMADMEGQAHQFSDETERALGVVMEMIAHFSRCESEAMIGAVAELLAQELEPSAKS